ncbi:CLOCK-interacting pacemaker [Salmo trutta]|uniref:CLOCK-interacting pacemaker b n=1 Tax=Salmo trutta TaxID=8032 RepID=A0A674AJU3_SALTR|nr:CLOCK-interacting pacemaker-like [Salmo trutta]XP_029588964.1 CLOCK-interacting pacemaker-like [Salmo trutta]XP_029588965.1 CLOCK-interacting pacemaker-like [Salmo trutta]XP_029588966.1 CLOCK-interacting pacemaker-like [Salmo trutta]XP_029588967.1 CLOCK-interacting pacemaker-like [Salmo trutta]
MISTKRKAEGQSRTMGKLRTVKSGSSRTDSERDSGFSDASTIDLTDSEDSSRTVSKREAQRPASGSHPSQLAVVGGSYSNMSPIIMKNVLLKQPRNNPPSQKPWGFSPAVEMVQQPQVVFVQPVVSPVVSHCTTSNPKEASSKRRRPKKYLPILRSYPKIAPHPGDSLSSSGRESSCYFPSSSPSASSHREHHHNHRNKHQRHQSSSSSCGSSGSSTPSLPSPSSSLSPSPQHRLTPSLTHSSACSSPARSSLAVSRSEFSPALSPALTVTPSDTLTSEVPEKTKTLSLPQPTVATTNDNSCHDDGNHDDNGDDHDIKRKRFCNTYNILSKSGLLEITLSTKDLIRQNRRTQVELDRLKEHTNLFLQALQTGDTSIWSKLQTSLQEEQEEKGSGQQSSLKADTD